jgi:hypothetical protein
MTSTHISSPFWNFGQTLKMHYICKRKHNLSLFVLCAKLKWHALSVFVWASKSNTIQISLYEKYQKKKERIYSTQLIKLGRFLHRSATWCSDEFCFPTKFKVVRVSICLQNATLFGGKHQIFNTLGQACLKRNIVIETKQKFVQYWF